MLLDSAASRHTSNTNQTKSTGFQFHIPIIPVCCQTLQQRTCLLCQPVLNCKWSTTHMADERIFKEAITAIERGEKERARSLLTRLLNEDKKNPNYWLYMSIVVESDQERIYCLENVLDRDPKNQAAKRALVLLGAKPPDPGLKPVKPELQRVWEVGEILSQSGEVVEKKPLVKLPLAQLALFGFLGVAIVALLYFGIFGNPFFINKSPGYILPTQIGESMYTLEASSTEQVGAEQSYDSFQNVIGPTPLALLLDATFTPTPRYIDTPHPSSGGYVDGIRAFDLQNWGEAIDRLVQHLDTHPEDADVRYYIGFAYYNLEKYMAAEEAFNKAINVNAKFGPAYWGRAISQIARSSDKSVIDDLGKAISISPDFVEAYITRAEYFIQRGSVDLAWKDIDTALSLAPLDARIFYLQNIAYLAENDVDKALEAARKAVKLDPTDVDNYFILGATLVSAGEMEEAIKPLQTYLTYEEENAEAWFYLGLAQQAGGFYDTALHVFEKAKELKKDYYEVDYYLGLSLYEMGDNEQAMELFKRASRNFPRWFEPKLYLGITYLKDEQYGLAYTNINASSGLAKNNQQLAALYYWRALASEALGNKDHADKDWQRLLDLPSSAYSSAWAATATQHLANPGGGGIQPAAPHGVPTVTTVP